MPELFGFEGIREPKEMKGIRIMQPCLCKNHFRQVANVFDKETAFAYAHDEKNCVICNQVIFIEGARRFVVGMRQNANEESLRLPNLFVHRGA